MGCVSSVRRDDDKNSGGSEFFFSIKIENPVVVPNTELPLSAIKRFGLVTLYPRPDAEPVTCDAGTRVAGPSQRKALSTAPSAAPSNAAAVSGRQQTAHSAASRSREDQVRVQVIPQLLLES